MGSTSAHKSLPLLQPYAEQRENSPFSPVPDWVFRTELKMNSQELMYRFLLCA